jgi:hypothetical protein
MRASRSVERCAAILRRLGSERSLALASELGEAWRRPWLVGLVDRDVATRTRCIAAICGGGLFEGLERPDGCPPIRVRYGDVTRFRATLADGTKEVLAMPAPSSEPAPKRPPISEEITAVQSPILEELRADLSTSIAQAAQAERALPRVLRERPPWWAFWLWIARWLLLVFRREQVTTRVRAVAVREATRKKLATLETPVVAAPKPDARDAFVSRLRELVTATGVQSILVESDRAILADSVELVELADAPDLTITFRGAIVRNAADDSPLGPVEQAVFELEELAARARAKRLVDRGREQILAETAVIEGRIARAEDEFRDRLATLERYRIADPERFKTEQLERAHPQVMSSLSAVLENASSHLAAELAQLASTWTRAVATATSTDELKATAERIDRESPQALTKLAEDVRRFVSGGITGSVHDLHPSLVAELASHGMSEAQLRERAHPTLPPLDKLRTLTAIRAKGFAAELGGVGKWITGLFRSLDAKRSELADLVAKHAAELHEQAMDELLEAEPELRVALLALLRVMIDAAVDRQIAWLDVTLAAERERIAREREVFAPQRELLEAVRSELSSLG